MPKEITVRGRRLIMHQQNGWRDRYSNWAPSLSSNPSRSTGLIRNHVTCASRIGASTESLFDATFTDGEGVRGGLGPLGSDVEIGLAETVPVTLMDPLKGQAALAEARRSRHKAVVLLTRGSRPGLFLLNAGSFSKPIGPPIVQVSSLESEWVKEKAQPG